MPLRAIVTVGMLTGLRVYKVLVSPLFAGSCRFIPSCSDYAREAVRQYGPFKGFCLTTKRLLRCQPWGGAGYDPVPIGPGTISAGCGLPERPNSPPTGS